MTYQIRRTTAETGEEIYLYQRSDGKKIALNSIYSPSKEIEKYLSKFEWNKKVLILIGIGNGLILHKLSETKEYIYIYAIEPYEELKLNEKTLEVIKENNIDFEYYQQFKLNSNKFRMILTKYIGLDFEIIIHPNYEYTDLNYIKEIIKELKEITKIIQINLNTELLFAKAWIIEPLLNLEYTLGLTAINELKDKFQGEKAILVASGPSLKDNIDIVKKMKEYSYVFAAGSAMNGLLFNGIIPDFVTVFDSSQVNYDVHFRNSKYNGPLIIGSIVNSDIVKNHQGEASLIIEEIDNITGQFRKDVLTFITVPSVAIFTLQVIYYLGFSEVYLVGQDLALLNGKYYAEGVNEHQGSINEKGTLFVENNLNEMVETTHPLYVFLQGFNSLIQNFEKDRLKIYNLSKNGAKINGAIFLPKENIDLSNWNKRKKIDIELTPIKSTVEGIMAQQKVIQELSNFSFILKKSLRKIKKINEKKVSLSEIKKVYKELVKLRSYPILENVVTNQFSMYILKLNNLFQYKLDKEDYTSQDLVLMVNEIRELFSLLDHFIEDILNDENVKKIKNKISKELEK